MTLWEERRGLGVAAALLVVGITPLAAAPAFAPPHVFAPARPSVVRAAPVHFDNPFTDGTALRLRTRLDAGRGSIRHERRQGDGVGFALFPGAFYGTPAEGVSVPAAPVSEVVDAVDERWSEPDGVPRRCVRPLIIDLASEYRPTSLPRVIYGSPPPPCRP